MDWIKCFEIILAETGIVILIGLGRVIMIGEIFF